MKEMSTGEKIARIIINQIQEDSGVEFAVTSRSIEFITSIIEQAHQQGLEQAAKFLESRADHIQQTNNITALTMANIYREEANNIRALIDE